HRLGARAESSFSFKRRVRAAVCLIGVDNRERPFTIPRAGGKRSQRCFQGLSGAHWLETRLPAGRSVSLVARRSSVCLERTVRDREVGGSNPLAPTILRNKPFGEYVEGLFLFQGRELPHKRGSSKARFLDRMLALKLPHVADIDA